MEFLKNHPAPDLILLDSQMDVLDGASFLTELEQSQPAIFFSTAIIVLSGVEKFSHARIFRALRKPVDFDHLETVMTAALAAREPPMLRS